MPWMKTGDNAATYPRLMVTAVDRDADDRTVNEVAGWLWRCFAQSAGHITDYLVDEGTALSIAGGPSSYARMLGIARRAGLIGKRPALREGIRCVQLIEDPEFIHIRLKAEIEWDRQQRQDTSNPRLKVPILLRDGDACRYCGVVVVWTGRPSNRKATLDHLEPGKPATAETMVVACWICNSAARDKEIDDRPNLQPAPIRPFYGKHSAKYLTANGHPTAPSDDSQRPAIAADNAPQRPARQAATAPLSDPDNAHSSDPDTAQPCDPAEAGQRASDPAIGDALAELANGGINAVPLPTETGFVWSGRDGPGRVPASDVPRSRRSRRGRPRSADWSR